MVVGDGVGSGPDGVGAEGAARTSSKWRRCCATSDQRRLERHQRAMATRRMSPKTEIQDHIRIDIMLGVDR